MFTQIDAEMGKVLLKYNIWNEIPKFEVYENKT